MDHEFLISELERMREWQAVNANWRNVKALDAAIEAVREVMAIRDREAAAYAG